MSALYRGMKMKGTHLGLCFLAVIDGWIDDIVWCRRGFSVVGHREVKKVDVILFLHQLAEFEALLRHRDLA